MREARLWRRQAGRRPAAGRGRPAPDSILPPPGPDRTRPAGAAARYALGAGLALAVFGVEYSAASFFKPAVFLLFFPGAFVTALLAGMGPAILNIALATAGALGVLVVAEQAPFIPDATTLLRMALFAASSTFAAWLIGRGRRAEAALQESAARLRIFRALADNSPDFIGIADPEGKPIYVNPAGRAMVGLAPDHPAEATEIHEYYPEDLRAFARDVILKSMRERGHWKGETYFRNFTTNERIPVWDEHFMIRERSGRIAGMGTITRDISERRRADDALRRSAAELKRAQEVAQIGSWRLDLPRDELLWSEQTYRMFGLPVGTKLSYASFLALVHPDDRARVDAAWKAALRGAPYEIEHRIISDGEVKWVHERAELELDAAGKAVRGVGTVQDVTARRKAEEDLSRIRERERFLTALEAAANAMVVVTLDGTIAYVNGEAERLFGWTRVELRGRGVESLFPERFRAGGADLRATFLAEGTGKRPMGAGRDLFALRNDGKEIPVEVSLTRVSEEEQQFVVASIMDLTLRKRAEAALRESEQRFRLLVHDTREYAIFMHDLEGRITVWNEGAERILGYTAAEALGESFTRFYAPEAAAASKPFADLRAALEKGSHADEDWRVRKDGSRFWAGVVITPIFGPDGRHLGYGKVIRDLTAPKKAEKTLKDTAERLRTTVLDLEAFSYTISHDLRSPLRAIQGYAHFLSLRLSPTSDPESRRMLERMALAAARLDLLIRDVLSYNAVAKEELAPQPVDLDDTLSHVADHYPELAKATLRVKPPLGRVRGQPSLMIQVLANLLTNAAKFVAPGRAAEIDVWTERLEGKVVLSVRDNGIGIPPEARGRLFRPFERLHRAEEYPGTGMGLAIIKKAVERMGGAVDVESEPGKGSVFRVTLPGA